MQNVTQIDMGMIQSDVKEIFDKWDIEAFAVVCDDHFVLVNLINEIIQVFAVDCTPFFLKMWLIGI